MNSIVDLHSRTHSVMEELQHVFQECTQRDIEGHILSAIVSVKMVQNILGAQDFSCSDIDPEELCHAV
jgi:hypothetical protein